MTRIWDFVYLGDFAAGRSGSRREVFVTQTLIRKGQGFVQEQSSDDCGQANCQYVG